MHEDVLVCVCARACARQCVHIVILRMRFMVACLLYACAVLSQFVAARVRKIESYFILLNSVSEETEISCFRQIVFSACRSNGATIKHYTYSAWAPALLL